MADASDWQRLTDAHIAAAVNPRKRSLGAAGALSLVWGRFEPLPRRNIHARFTSISRHSVGEITRAAMAGLSLAL
jgi:hypothetical protein